MAADRLFRLRTERLSFTEYFPSFLGLIEKQRDRLFPITLSFLFWSYVDLMLMHRATMSARLHTLYPFAVSSLIFYSQSLSFSRVIFFFFLCPMLRQSERLCLSARLYALFSFALSFCGISSLIFYSEPSDSLARLPRRCAPMIAWRSSSSTTGRNWCCSPHCSRLAFSAVFFTVCFALDIPLSFLAAAFRAFVRSFSSSYTLQCGPSFNHFIHPPRPLPPFFLHLPFVDVSSSSSLCLPFFLRNISSFAHPVPLRLSTELSPVCVLRTHMMGGAQDANLDCLA
jgi:hypothetical protein